jgi:hypothetical protein
MNIEGVDVYPGHACPHSTGKGCDDYANRPVEPCVNFMCGWVMEGSPLPEWMKPSNAKVLVLFNKLTWAGRPVDVAVPVGRRIPPRALNWLKQFAEKNLRPLIYTEQSGERGKYSREQTVLGHGPPEFQKQVVQWIESGKKLW